MKMLVCRAVCIFYNLFQNAISYCSLSAPQTASLPVTLLSEWFDLPSIQGVSPLLVVWVSSPSEGPMTYQSL